MRRFLKSEAIGSSSNTVPAAPAGLAPPIGPALPVPPPPRLPTWVPPARGGSADELPGSRLGVLSSSPPMPLDCTHSRRRVGPTSEPGGRAFSASCSTLGFTHTLRRGRVTSEPEEPTSWPSPVFTHAERHAAATSELGTEATAGPLRASPCSAAVAAAGLAGKGGAACPARNPASNSRLARLASAMPAAGCCHGRCNSLVGLGPPGSARAGRRRRSAP